MGTQLYSVGSGVRHGRTMKAALLALVAAFGGLLLLAAFVGSAPAAQAALPDNCQPSGSQVVCTFEYTGAAQSWTVPDGVSQATFDVYGAQGGSEPSGKPGGLGGKATATIAVNPGDTLRVNVGGAGGNGTTTQTGPGGFNGGGGSGSPGGSLGAPAGGGGGASDVRSGAFGLANRIIVAGGGGGAGGFGGAGGVGGGLFGTAGGDATSVFGTSGGGGGGTSSAGGSGGAGSGGNGRAGGSGFGGDGGSGSGDGSGGGGGGGGYYGGGGGGGGASAADGGGGGGGSGFGPSSVVFIGGVREGNGLVTITYTPDSTAATTTIALDPASPNDWYTSAVKATISASDGSGSGVTETRCVLDPATAPTSFDDLPSGCDYTGAGASVSSDGRHTLYAASKDSAGNKEQVRSTTFKIDQTAPTVTCGTPSPVFVLRGAGGNVTATVSDATSGPVATSLSATVSDVSTVGNKSVSLTGTDNAGNSTTISCPYSVKYGFSGFLSPVPQTSYKAGSTIPVKFKLKDASGRTISDRAARALVADCKVKVLFRGTTNCATYNATTNTFKYNLKTPGSLSSGLYTIKVEVSAPDGSGVVNNETGQVYIRADDDRR